MPGRSVPRNVRTRKRNSPRQFGKHAHRLKLCRVDVRFARPANLVLVLRAESRCGRRCALLHPPAQQLEFVVFLLLAASEETDFSPTRLWSSRSTDRHENPGSGCHRDCRTQERARPRRRLVLPLIPVAAGDRFEFFLGSIGASARHHSPPSLPAAAVHWVCA